MCERLSFRGKALGLRCGDERTRQARSQRERDVGKRLASARDYHIGVSTGDVIGGARDRDARRRAREADGERWDARRHRKREDDLTREVVIGDRPRGIGLAWLAVKRVSTL